jgi:hypothetical protein
MAWLVLHLVASAVLAGIAWAVQVVVYPAFALVGPDRWAAYHAAHTRAITRVVVLPWLVQGVSVVGLLLASPPGGRGLVLLLGALALAAVVLTFAAAVPAHRLLGSAPDGGGPVLSRLRRAHLVRSLVWSASVVISAIMVG